jgi:hypothetical protein
MENLYIEFTKKFASRKHLRKKVNLEFREDKDRARLFCDSPQIAARYASELRQVVAKNDESGRTLILVRGQANNHK